MNELKINLKNLNNSILELEGDIEDARRQAQANVDPLVLKLSKVKEDKRIYASRNDFESVQEGIRKENNLKFRIDAQWNQYSILKNELTKLLRKKEDLESQIKLEEDKIKRKIEILSQMDNVLDNYQNTQNLKQASIDARINYEYVQQWIEWGKNDFNETYAYFYQKIIEIDEHFNDLESQKLKKQMDKVIDAYRKTNSLKEASRIANVSYDTVEYWYSWGSRGFGEENTYFFKNITEKSGKMN